MMALSGNGQIQMKPLEDLNMGETIQKNLRSKHFAYSLQTIKRQNLDYKEKQPRPEIKENGQKNKRRKRVKSRGTLNTGLPSLNREVNTFPIYLPLKSCLFCHHPVKLLYLGRKRHPCRNLGVASMRTSPHPAQGSTSFQSRDSTHPKINLSSHPGGQLCLWCSHH